MYSIYVVGLHRLIIFKTCFFSCLDQIYIYIGVGIGAAILVIFGIILFCKCKQKHRFQRKSISRNEFTTNYYDNLPNSFSNMTLESDEFVSARELVKFAFKSKYTPKPYGELGEAATNAFITRGHNKRLSSITTISSSQSISSMAQVVQELQRGNSPLSAVPTSIKRLEERRDTGYVDVNLPSKAELAARRSSELKDKNQKPVPMKRPFNMLQQIHLKQRRTSQIPSDTDSNDYLTPVVEPKNDRAKSYATCEPGNENVFSRHASTGQAFDYCRKVKHTLSQKIANPNSDNKSSNNTLIYGNTLVYSPSTDSVSSNGYADLEVFQKSEYTETSLICNSTASGYNTVNKGAVSKDDSDYEIPQDFQLKQTEDKDHANLNAKSGYQNFNYNVPNLNPTAVDKEDEYIEFIPENTTKM